MRQRSGHSSLFLLDCILACWSCIGIREETIATLVSASLFVHQVISAYNMRRAEFQAQLHAMDLLRSEAARSSRRSRGARQGAYIPEGNTRRGSPAYDKGSGARHQKARGTNTSRFSRAFPLRVQPVKGAAATSSVHPLLARRTPSLLAPAAAGPARGAVLGPVRRL